MLPSLNALRVFEAVARHGHFTRAAEELSISQSAVSHQIRNLERFLDTPLLKRHAQQATLTSDGALLFRNLSDAFALLNRAVADVCANRAHSTIGVSLRPHFAARWLAPRMTSLWGRHPGLNVRFLHSNVPADFADPHIHVSIEWRHDSTVPADARPIMPGDLTPAVSPNLITGKTPLRTPADLARHCLLHETDETSWTEWLRLAGEPDLEPVRKVYYEDTNVRHHATLEGEGVSLVCPALVRDDISAGRIVCPFDIRLQSYAYYLVVPAARYENANVRKFANWALSESDRG